MLRARCDGPNEGYCMEGGATLGRRVDASRRLPGEQSRRLSTRLTLRLMQHLQRRAVIATSSSPSLARDLGGFGWKVRRTCRQPLVLAVR
jgi:hypothetical protein